MECTLAECKQTKQADLRLAGNNWYKPQRNCWFGRYYLQLANHYTARNAQDVSTQTDGFGFSGTAVSSSGLGECAVRSFLRIDSLSDFPEPDFDSLRPLSLGGGSIGVALLHCECGFSIQVLDGFHASS
jgi:hypothetical protein